MVKEERDMLSNGLPIPKLGLGTWFIEDEYAAQAIRDAVNVGYRHIDTAQAFSRYGKRWRMHTMRENWKQLVYPILKRKTWKISFPHAG